MVKYLLAMGALLLSMGALSQQGCLEGTNCAVPPVILCDAGEDCGPPPNPSGSYDLSDFNIPFPVNWPAEPNTSRTISVSSIGEFQNAVRESNATINVASGSYNGSLSITGSDLDIRMSNSATLYGSISAQARNQRIRWTGGNIRNNGQEMTLRSVSDVLFDDIHIDGAILLHRDGGTPNRRVAFINSTLDARASSTTQFTIYTHQDSSMPRHSDLLFANVNMDNGVNSPFRIQHAERVVVVDSAFNLRNSSGTGFRFSVGTNQTYVADSVIVGRIHLNYLDYANGAVTNSVWENVRRYTTSSANPGAFANQNPGNSGVVRNPTVYSESWGVGNSPSGISPFQGVGISPVQAWDGRTLPNPGNYGARR